MLFVIFLESSLVKGNVLGLFNRGLFHAGTHWHNISADEGYALAHVMEINPCTSHLQCSSAEVYLDIRYVYTVYILHVHIHIHYIFIYIYIYGLTD